MFTIATASCLAKEFNPIIGFSSKARIDEAVQSSKHKLDDADVRYLEEP